jgi:hypothetical protein
MSSVNQRLAISARLHKIENLFLPLNLDRRFQFKTPPKLSIKDSMANLKLIL